MTLKPCGFYCRSNSSSQPLKGYIWYRQVISKFIKQYYILSSESWVKNIHIIKSESEKPLSCVRLFAILQARILEWVAFPFSRGSSQLRDQTQVSRIAGGFFTSWATREAQHIIKDPSYKLAWEIWHVYLVGWLTVKDKKKQTNNNDIICCCCCSVAKSGPTSCKQFF